MFLTSWRVVTILLFLVIVFASGYVLFGYYSHQKQILQFKTVERKQRFQEKTTLQVQAAWQEILEQTLGYSTRIMDETPDQISKGLETVAHGREEILRAFYITEDTIYLARWKKIRRQKQSENFAIGIVDNPDFKLAEIQEYQNKDFSAAVVTYEQFWLQNPDDFYAANALARCLYKMGEFDRSQKIYKQIYRQNPDRVTADELPLAITAAFQLLNIYASQKNENAAKELGLAFYQDVLNERWDLTENKTQLFLEKISTDMQPYLNDRAVHRKWARLKEYEKQIQLDKVYVRFISDKIIPLIGVNQEHTYHVYFMPELDTSNTRFLLVQPYHDGYLVLEIDLRVMIQGQFNKKLQALEHDTLKCAVMYAPLTGEEPSRQIKGSFSVACSNQFPGVMVTVYETNSLKSNTEIQVRKIRLMFIIGYMGFILILGFLFWVFYRQVRLAEMKSEFISHVSHELKTPLTSLSAFSEMILNDPDLPMKKIRYYCGFLQSESMRLARLIENLMDITRMERQKINYRFSPHTTDRVLKEAVKIFKKSVVPQEHIIRSNLNAKHPIPMDKDAMIRVILNLLDNARKYSEPGTVITLTSRQTPHSTEITIADQGMGMSRSELRQVFKKYYQAKRTYEEKYKGVGLGLAIVKNMITAHAGRISITSILNQGTTVHITLPG